MSRLDSSSSKTSSLPRPCTIKAVARVPTAVAPWHGQAFSSATAAAVAADKRFAKADRLMAKIVDAEARWLEVNESENRPLWKKLNDKWYDARRALENFETEITDNPGDPALDAVLFARISNFWWSVDGEDICNELESYPSFLRSIECTLRAAGCRIASPRPQQPSSNLDIAPRPTPIPLSVNAGRVIAQIRSIGRAYIASLTRETSLVEDMIEMQEAVAITDRRNGELEELHHNIMARRSPCEQSSYDFSQLDDFVVWIELVAAYRSDLFGEAIQDSRCSPILRKMLARARETGDDRVKQAECWNASQGGANA